MSTPTDREGEETRGLAADLLSAGGQVLSGAEWTAGSALVVGGIAKVTGKLPSKSEETPKE